MSYTPITAANPTKPSWTPKLVLICKATEALPEELRQNICLLILDSSVLVLQKHAKEMLKRSVQRDERIALRYYETHIMEQDEPVLIINGRWKWRFNYLIEYHKRIDAFLSAPVFNLPFKNPKYSNKYNYPNYMRRVVPCLARHSYF